MKHYKFIFAFLSFASSFLRGESIDRKNYIQSFVLFVDGSNVALSDGTIYIERFEKLSDLEPGDFVIRQSGNPVYGGMTYNLFTDIDSTRRSFFLNVSSSEPYLHQIQELVEIESGLQVTLEDGSKWVIGEPQTTDPKGDQWYNPSWEVGDRVLISFENSGSYKMDNITKYNVAFVEI